MQKYTSASLKWLKRIFAGFFLIFIFTSSLALAAEIPSILPGDTTTVPLTGYAQNVCYGLADKIRGGDITLRHIPCFLQYFAQSLIAIAGSLSVIFVMVGGYRYILGSDQDKDEAKRTVTYALVGLAVSLLAWVIVDLVLQIITE